MAVHVMKPARIKPNSKRFDTSKKRLQDALTALDESVTNVLSTHVPTPKEVKQVLYTRLKGRDVCFLILDYRADGGVTMVPIAKKYADALVKAGMNSGS